MNKLDRLFKQKNQNLLAIYTMAGYPKLHSTEDTLLALDAAGVDIIEIGLPYSDPLADGPTIQQVAAKALDNGMHIDLLFKQLLQVKEKIKAPLVLMGYYNQFLQYGPEKFLQRCQNKGVSGIIFPDMPLQVYQEEHQKDFEKHQIKISFLITPKTPTVRIQELDKASTGFLYVVSSSATTGGQQEMNETQIAYFQKLQKLKLTSPKLIGFGISTPQAVQIAQEYAQGAIVGSAFLKTLKEAASKEKISGFVNYLTSKS